jgi:hypothetical protein
VDCRIFTGFLEGAVPKERKYGGCVWNKGNEISVPEERKQATCISLEKKKHPVRTNGNHADWLITAACALHALDRESSEEYKNAQEREWM